MTKEPDDIDALLARLEQMRQTLEHAILKVEADHAVGRTGYGTYARAAMIEADYRELYAVVQARISEALAALGNS